MNNFILRTLACALMAMTSPLALAQSQQTPAPAATPANNLLKAEELDQLVAPIALYPDALLAEVLMASTYPLEVVEATRWIDANKSLKGDALKAAADKQSWDDSVKSLTVTPSVLSMMSTQLSWTQKLGDAVLAQQADIMDAVQRLRTKAEAQDKLKTTKQQKVTKATEGSKQVIVIEPAEPDTIYVPYYDPAVVYGAWPYPAYPPYYWPAPPGYYAGAAIATGLAFTAGIAVGAWAAGGHYWGGGFAWGNNNINVNRNININNINVRNNTWQHNPAHRQGVRYNNANVANRYSKGISGANNRLDYRGRNGQPVINPNANRPNAGNRPGGGNRPNAGNRPSGSNRPSANNRPGGGNRPSAGNRPGGGQRPASRPSGGGRGAFSNIGSGHAANLQSARGRASMGGRGGGGGFHGGGRGGGGFHGGGGRGGGGRRSDIRLKHDIVLLGRLDNGLGYYRFTYNGGTTAYVGVMAQEVRRVVPGAVTVGSDGYYRVSYERLGLPFETYGEWVAEGAHLPHPYTATLPAVTAHH